MTMNHKKILMSVFCTAFLITVSLTPVFGWSPFGKKTSSDLPSEVAESIIGVTKSSGGDVEVDLTPVYYEKGSLQVKISINTHNVDDLYKYDLSEITTLQSGGISIRPSKSPRLGGHHNNGKYEFKLDQLTKEGFVITISDLNSPGKREFSWP